MFLVILVRKTWVKGAELLKLIPQTEISVVERCSGHGGAWGYKKDHFEIAMKVGKPAARQLYGAEKSMLFQNVRLQAFILNKK